ncbi:uncharacterized protein METZ01_LOCUS246354 [marine metagenome]|uniref:Uncharacterized protein n=1 Tax=marine metagenome TaxID=408172 RepID=A0A382I1J7_9ZZZZ
MSVNLRTFIFDPAAASILGKNIKFLEIRMTSLFSLIFNP